MHAQDVTPARLANSPSWLLTQTAMHAGRLIAEGFSSVGFRGHHYRVLATLEEFGPASQAALGRRSGIYGSDIVATVNELADQNLVERLPDPVDRRRNIIVITPAGSARLASLDERLAQVQEALLAPLTEQERRELMALLTRLLSYHAAPAKASAR